MINKQATIYTEPKPNTVIISRTSLWDDDIPPCKGAYEILIQYPGASKPAKAWVIDLDPTTVFEFSQSQGKSLVVWLDPCGWHHIEIYDYFRE